MSPSLKIRIKLILTLLFLVIVGLARDPLILILLSFPLIIGISLLPDKRNLIRQYIQFLPFIVLTFCIRAWFTPGKLIGCGMTYPGLYTGIILGTKILFAVGYSLCFINSTNSFELVKSIDWITMNRLKLGEITLVALNFVELIKEGVSSKRPIGSILKYAIKESCNLVTTDEYR